MFRLVFRSEFFLSFTYNTIFLYFTRIVRFCFPDLYELNTKILLLINLENAESFQTQKNNGHRKGNIKRKD